MNILSDWELGDCARQQINQYGNDGAVSSAASRADAPLAECGMAGHSLWISILDRIRQLTEVREAEFRQ